MTAHRRSFERRLHRYAPGSGTVSAVPLTFTGGSSGSTGCSILVAPTINFTGPSSLSASCTDFANGSPIKKVALAE